MSEASYRLIDDIRKLIGDGDIEQAIERLKSVLQADRSEPYNEILLHESRYRRLRRDERKGTLARESFQVEINKLMVSLLGMVEELPPRLREKAPSVYEAVLSVQGGPQYADLAFQKILGIHNLKQISWIECGLRVSRGVCRILTPNGFGTGFLINHEMIMTNNHVISDTVTAGESQAEFNYQEDASGGFLPAARYHLDANRFRTNSELDYTVVGIRPDPSMKHSILASKRNSLGVAC